MRTLSLLSALCMGAIAGVATVALTWLVLRIFIY